MLGGGVPLRHSNERATVHHDSPVAPGLRCNPFHNVATVPPNLQTKIVVLVTSGSAAPPHVYLHENVTAPDETGEFATLGAIDVVLSEFQHSRRSDLQIRGFEDPSLELHAIPHRNHAAHFDAIGGAYLCSAERQRHCCDDGRCNNDECLHNYRLSHTSSFFTSRWAILFSE